MCDTAVVLGNATADGSVIFAKNSDRPANECQPLNYYPRRCYSPGTRLRCTWIEIPQARETFAVLGSRPYWIWGFEIGVNEHGVAIGNEAVYSREPYLETGLLGMDLIRLGLERGRTAYDAMHVIIDLLEEFGQGGSCDVANYRTYHNSFILADASGAWVLETAGRRWVAQKVTGRRSISNVLTIESEWDEASPDLVEHAVQQGWWQHGQEFGFARAYGAPERDVRSGRCRFTTSSALLNQGGRLTPADLATVLRDHGGLLEDGTAAPICMHAVPPPRTGETAASFVVQIRPDLPAYQRTVAWTSFGSPCMSLPVPICVGGAVPPAILGVAGSRFDPVSPWWRNERIQRRVDLCPALKPAVQEHLRDAECALRRDAERIDAEASTMPECDARRAIQRLADQSTEKLLETLSRLEQLTASVAGLKEQSPGYVDHWAKINGAVGLSLWE